MYTATSAPRSSRARMGADRDVAHSNAVLNGAAAGLVGRKITSCDEMTKPAFTASGQRHRFVLARSRISSPRPLITAFTMKRVKPFAISTVIEGGAAGCWMSKALRDRGRGIRSSPRRPGG